MSLTQRAVCFSSIRDFCGGKKNESGTLIEPGRGVIGILEFSHKFARDSFIPFFPFFSQKHSLVLRRQNKCAGKNPAFFFSCCLVGGIYKQEREHPQIYPPSLCLTLWPRKYRLLINMIINQWSRKMSSEIIPKGPRSEELSHFYLPKLSI